LYCSLEYSLPLKHGAKPQHKFELFHFFQTELAESGLPVNTVAVVSLAGQNVLDPTRRWTPGFKQNVWASRVNTTQSLAHAIIKAPFKPKVFISISGVGKTVRSFWKVYWSLTLSEEFKLQVLLTYSVRRT
jgi:NAD dependent epimerase/dehydratase family enzyme